MPPPAPAPIVTLPAGSRPVPARWPGAVLFDRDGTLVVDVAYNGDPAQVVLVPGAADAVAAVRAVGLGGGLVTNQSGVARRPLDVTAGPAGNARGAARSGCAVIGDIGADVEAARAAGALGVLVPTPITLAAEVAAAPLVAHDLAAAVRLVLERVVAPPLG